MNSTLINFYLDLAPDNKGRTLSKILSMQDKALEETHDYIQWLFPLVEPSKYNSDAPLLDELTIELFKMHSPHDNLRGNMRRSIDRMKTFYGLNHNGKKHWLNPLDHNYLRITRILTSLTILGFKEEAEDIMVKLRDIYKDNKEIIGEKAMTFWENALRYRPFFNTDMKIQQKWENTFDKVIVNDEIIDLLKEVDHTKYKD